jgi:chromosome segregation protein
LRKKVDGIEEHIASFEENIQLTSVQMGENDAGARRAADDIAHLEREQAGHEKELESITDDIVAALDAGLKEAGYSASARRSAESALEEALGRLKALLSGREALAADLAAALERGAETGVGDGSLAATAESLRKALNEAASHAARALSLFDEYRKSTPSFIDEFLAPEGIITKKRGLDAEIRAAKEGVLQKRERIAALRQDNENLSGKIEEYRKTLEGLRVNRAQMMAQAQAAEEQARLIRRELAGQEGLLKNIQDELFLNRKRFEETNDRISDTEQEIAEIEQKGLRLTADIDKLEKDIAWQNSDAAGRQETLKKKRDDLDKIQQVMEKIHLELAQAETEIKNIQDNFRETHSRDLMEFEERIFTITAQPAELREKLAAARQSLRDLGSVNLMAVEEFAETKERYDFLSNQLADLARAREDLENITAEIRAESSALFLATYNKIKKNFHNMFRRLFGGGRGELRLVDANHVLESGIEIFAQPPGKKLENIALLSGGEKSMTAVALLFATYMVKPSPFCLLDEIDAALDEVNVSRFVQLLREFGHTSQFIVITHNKKTVTGASTLLGVTMEESGITKAIAIKLEHSDDAAAATERPEGMVDDTYVEEDVEPEEGRELPIGVDDPSRVSEAELRPIRHQKTGE